MRKLSAVLLLCGCMTYDFEPVTPLTVAQGREGGPVFGKKPKPNVMLLLDKSRSMADPIDRSVASCAGCGSSGTLCPASCPTRISELRAAMNSFLSTSGTVARLGLEAFPSDSSCALAGSAAVLRVPLPGQADDVDADLQAKADEVNASIQVISDSAAEPENTVVGGTPTARALEAVGTNPALATEDREDFVLLLTDGLPNCNASNPNTCTNPAACRCTQMNGCGTSGLCTIGCLDDEGTTAAIAALRARNIKTIVVGFGADTLSGDALSVLDAMASAGDFPRRCPNGTDAECGAGGCEQATRLCTRKFYQAANGVELAEGLADISRLLNPNVCVFVLEEPPTDPSLISLRFDGTSLGRGPDTWTYANGELTVNGIWCDRIKAATPKNPVNVDIRVLEIL